LQIPFAFGSAHAVVLAACGSDPVHHVRDAALDATPIDGEPLCTTSFDDGTGPVATDVSGAVTFATARSPRTTSRSRTASRRRRWAA
jgi:hypothetical protein